MRASTLIVTDLAKRYGRRWLFRALSFSQTSGEIVAITGANGSGKSTLLRILGGVLRATAGEVHLQHGDRPIAPENRAFHMGLVAPYLNLYRDLTARENLAFIARARGLPDAGQHIEMVLDLVQLPHRADEPVHRYSSGQLQRAKFAAAVLAKPHVLLLDEPSSNLDQAGLDMVAAVMAHQKARGGLVVIATNDPTEAERCDRQVCVEDYR